MAKFCLNCNKSIGLFDKPYKLPSLDVCFCERCKDKVEPLFRQIDSVSEIFSGKDEIEFEKDFEEKSQFSSLRTEVYKTVQKAFRLKQIEKGRMNVFIRSFEASFHDSYEAIRRAGDAITNCDVTSNIVTVDDTKAATFVFEWIPNRLIMGDTLTILVVTLVHSNGVAYVTSKGASDYFGSFHGMNYKFWKEIERQNPDFEIKNIWELDYER